MNNLYIVFALLFIAVLIWGYKINVQNERKIEQERKRVALDQEALYDYPLGSYFAAISKDGEGCAIKTIMVGLGFGINNMTIDHYNKEGKLAERGICSTEFFERHSLINGVGVNLGV